MPWSLSVPIPKNLLCAVAMALAAPSNGAPFALPADSNQLILGIADDWTSTTVKLSRWARTDHGRWKQIGDEWLGRLGKDGLGWGVGLHPKGLPGPLKTEKDARAPAGVFELGDAYGYAASVQTNPRLPYHQVGPRDMWIEDSDSKYYNQHLRLPHAAPRNAWEKKQQMRLNDHAHSLKLFIKHNAPPNAQPGMGSAIFFHIWRQDGRIHTAGCTTMPEDRLRQLLQWVDPAQRPLFVLLPRQAYEQVHRLWTLP